MSKMICSRKHFVAHQGLFYKQKLAKSPEWSGHGYSITVTQNWGVVTHPKFNGDLFHCSLLHLTAFIHQCITQLICQHTPFIHHFNLPGITNLSPIIMHSWLTHQHPRILHISYAHQHPHILHTALIHQYISPRFNLSETYNSYSSLIH